MSQLYAPLAYVLEPRRVRATKPAGGRARRIVVFFCCVCVQDCVCFWSVLGLNGMRSALAGVVCIEGIELVSTVQRRIGWLTGAVMDKSHLQSFGPLQLASTYCWE